MDRGSRIGSWNTTVIRVWVGRRNEKRRLSKRTVWSDDTNRMQ